MHFPLLTASAISATTRRRINVDRHALSFGLVERSDHRAPAGRARTRDGFPTPIPSWVQCLTSERQPRSAGRGPTVAPRSRSVSGPGRFPGGGHSPTQLPRSLRRRRAHPCAPRAARARSPTRRRRRRRRSPRPAGSNRSSSTTAATAAATDSTIDRATTACGASAPSPAAARTSSSIRAGARNRSSCTSNTGASGASAARSSSSRRGLAPECPALLEQPEAGDVLEEAVAADGADLVGEVRQARGLGGVGGLALDADDEPGPGGDECAAVGAQRARRERARGVVRRDEVDRRPGDSPSLRPAASGGGRMLGSTPIASTRSVAHWPVVTSSRPVVPALERSLQLRPSARTPRARGASRGGSPWRARRDRAQRAGRSC